MLPEKLMSRRSPPPPVSRELKRRWSHFIRKVYETDPLICSQSYGERRIRIISIIDKREAKRN